MVYWLFSAVWMPWQEAPALPAGTTGTPSRFGIFTPQLWGAGIALVFILCVVLILTYLLYVRWPDALTDNKTPFRDEGYRYTFAPVIGDGDSEFPASDKFKQEMKDRAKQDYMPSKATDFKFTPEVLEYHVWYEGKPAAWTPWHMPFFSVETVAVGHAEWKDGVKVEKHKFFVAMGKAPQTRDEVSRWLTQMNFYQPSTGVSVSGSSTLPGVLDPNVQGRWNRPKIK